MTKFFLFAYLLVFPFGQFTRLSLEGLGGRARFFGPEVRIYLGDVLVGLAVGSWLISKSKTNLTARQEQSKRKKSGRGALTGPILLFAGVAAWSLLVNMSWLTYHESLTASFYLIRWIVYAGLYFVVGNIEKRKAKSEKRKSRTKSLKLLDLLILVGGITAVLGLLQYFFFPDLRVWLEARHWDPHYYRVYGTFFDPGYFGMMMVLGLILVMSQILNSKFQNKFRLITYPLSLITCYFALALTYSRSSYLAFLVGMGVIAWRLKKPRFYAGVVGIFLVTILLLPRPGGEGVRLEREASIKARILNWKQSLTIAKDHPIFGVGFNAYRYAQRDYGFLDQQDWQVSHAGAGADSSLLFVFATTGFVGLAAYLWILKKILHTSTESLVVFASLSALLAHSLFLNSLFYPWTMAWMWILLGNASGD